MFSFLSSAPCFGSRTCESPINKQHAPCQKSFFADEINDTMPFRLLDKIMSTCLFQPSLTIPRYCMSMSVFCPKDVPLTSASSIRNLLLSSSGHPPFVLCLCSLCDLAAVFIPHGFKNGILGWLAFHYVLISFMLDLSGWNLPLKL